MTTPRFPGATEFSLVSLYDTLGTACCGGTPHVHTVCTEAYIGISGSGTVETLSGSGHEIHNIAPGTVVWFSPGVIHRGVPASEAVDVLVLMQNAGLPEAGDAVLTLPRRYWDRPEDYASIVSLEADTPEHKHQLVLQRRALAAEGFDELVARHQAHGAEGLGEFFDYVLAVVTPKLETMTDIVNQTAAQEVRATLDALHHMRSGSSSHLLEGSAAHTTCGDTRYGMCGMLQPFKSGAEVSVDLS